MKRPTLARPCTPTAAAARLGALSALLALSACAPDADKPTNAPAHATSAPEYGTRLTAIRDGAIDHDTTSVVGIGSELGICSGTLIAPNLVLTARHCVARSGTALPDCSADFQDAFSPESFGVTTDTELERDSDFFHVDQVLVSDETGFCDNDVALLLLSENVPSEVATPRIPRIDAEPMISEGYSAVGYGNPRAGTRRRLDGRTVTCQGRNCGDNGQVLGRTDWVGDGGVCSGDSGGPAFDFAGRVIGVASRGDDECEFSIYASVALWSDWIRDAGAMAAELGGYEAAEWVTTGRSFPEGDPDWDGVHESEDNCPDVYNPEQLDVDGDGIGDACDPLNDALRGGDCPVCDGCLNDEGCEGDAICVDSERGGICTFACTQDSDCPFNTICGDIDGRSGSVCLNDNYLDDGVCDAVYLCLDRGEPEPRPDAGNSDAGAGDVGEADAGDDAGNGADAGSGDDASDAASSDAESAQEDVGAQIPPYLPPSGGGCTMVPSQHTGTAPLRSPPLWGAAWMLFRLRRRR